jgi:hypothetical protein
VVLLTASKESVGTIVELRSVFEIVKRKEKKENLSERPRFLLNAAQVFPAPT